MPTNTLTSSHFAYVCGLVRKRSAIELDASKSYLIAARLGNLARQTGYASAVDLVQGLQAKNLPELEQMLVEAMTTNETSFFRDLHPFEALRSVVLPQMLATRSTKRALNIWSAACSTGQELYSIAIYIREHFPQLSHWKLNLLGTDISDEVLSKARLGRFTQLEVNRGLPAAYLIKYFQRDGLHWQVRPEIKSMVSFQKLDLIEPWPHLPTMDLVLLRNVMIYFSTEVKKQILQKIRARMPSDGILFLGAAETTLRLDADFDCVQNASCIYYTVK